jgi:hypothetical protein
VRNAPWCWRPDVLALLPQVQRHEGTTADPNSHVSTLHNSFVGTLGTKYEALVRSGYPSQADLRAIHATAVRLANQYTKAITEVLNNPITITCSYRF